MGKIGEDLAFSYLFRKGYKIVTRNYRTKFGEIDLISIDAEGVLVFVEVKTLSGESGSLTNLLPEDNLSRWKLHKLQRICQFFANAYPALAEKNGWQIDLVAIVIGPKSYKAKHYKNL